ncbi:MAG: hypothetical protein COB67_08885 [SAR324 cluster bacterium]|uniref:Uncharacterized protein n=1 Tax=SAR324 cluster bacterium TaxID=2024889 RepID=A0A2A4T1V0_9DELT|nr:MAG: hypothetical protein COB67_08885 [SAR324 cluster bacterium]
MALPVVVGFLAVAVAWITKKVAMLATIFPLAVVVSVVSWTLYITSFTFAITIFVYFYNGFQTVSDKFTEASSSTNIAFQVASASGVMQAMADVISLFLLMLFMLFQFKLLHFLRGIADKSATEIHRAANLMLH